MTRLYFSFLFVCFCFPLSLLAQADKQAVPNAHSHNDYGNDTPFFKAYNQGYGSIEVDIFPVNSELYVAHDKKEIQVDKTLKRLYLDPLSAKLKSDPQRTVQLLIDIKENYAEALPLLVRQLKPLESYLTAQRLVVNISGNRPLPAEYCNYPSYISFDDDLVHDHTKEQWARVGLVSLQFGLFSKWKGEDSIPPVEEDRLRRIIHSVHHAGKAIRFWGAPDTLRSWELQLKLGVDFIGTDRIEALGRFLRQKYNSLGKVDE